MGVFGLKASLVLNNGFNLIAAANGMLPYTETNVKEEDEPIEIMVTEAEEERNKQSLKEDKASQNKEKKKKSKSEKSIQEAI